MTIEGEEYVPMNLWLREKQMELLTEEASDKSITTYSLIRRIIDFYYENRDKV